MILDIIEETEGKNIPQSLFLKIGRTSASR
jgi:hypothetical protein